MAYVNPENVIEKFRSSSSLKLRSAAMEAYAKLLVGVRSAFKIYGTPF